MPAGITAQYGFLYQRYAFIKIALENVGMDKFFVYEGVDDIDIIEENRICAIKLSNKTYAQVKSGTVSRDCWAKVIGNWLLSDEDSPSYRIILENDLTFDIRENKVISGICDYFKKGAARDSSSIANKVYKKYIDGKNDAIDNLKKVIESLLDQVTTEIITFESLKSSIEETFKDVYCTDIKVYDAAKICRCERFVSYINAEIDAAIAKKKSYTFLFVDFMNFYNKAASEISDGKYVIDIGEMKKRKRKEAEALLSSDTLREIHQLRLVNPNGGFIINELLKEMLYRDFRDVYSEAELESTLISNIEETAYSNFEDAKFSLPGNAIPKQLFDNTVNRSVPLSIVNDSPLYRNGCYVYLTGEGVDKRKQITWGEDNE